MKPRTHKADLSRRFALMIADKNSGRGPSGLTILGHIWELRVHADHKASGHQCAIYTSIKARIRNIDDDRTIPVLGLLGFA